MATTIDRSSQSDPSYALQLSQQANSVLSKPAPASTFFPLSLLTTAETPDSWTELERLFVACLRTGDDESAHLCLERLTQRFGASDERVMGLRGLYQEAVAQGSEDLEQILSEYEDVLSENPMNVVRCNIFLGTSILVDTFRLLRNGGSRSCVPCDGLKMPLRRL